MSYQCYVFNNEQQLIEDMKHYKQMGGQLSSLKILIRDIEHGHLLSAEGYRHVDYLAEMIVANREVLSREDNGITFAAGITTGQVTPTVINGLFDQQEQYALDVLEAYGLEGNRASEALRALRAGQYLLFVEAYDAAEQRQDNPLSDTFLASFGTVWNSDNRSTESEAASIFQRAQYTL